jgi:hypothetical protein
MFRSRWSKYSPATVASLYWINKDQQLRNRVLRLENRANKLEDNWRAHKNQQERHQASTSLSPISPALLIDYLRAIAFEDQSVPRTNFRTWIGPRSRNSLSAATSRQSDASVMELRIPFDISVALGSTTELHGDERAAPENTIYRLLFGVRCAIVRVTSAGLPLQYGSYTRSSCPLLMQ